VWLSAVDSGVVRFQSSNAFPKLLCSIMRLDFHRLDWACSLLSCGAGELRHHCYTNTSRHQRRYERARVDGTGFYAHETVT